MTREGEDRIRSYKDLDVWRSRWLLLKTAIGRRPISAQICVRPAFTSPTHHLTTHHLTTNPHETLRRRPHPRFHAGVCRPVRQLPAGAARRRRHQDRAPGRRRHAPRPAQQGLVGPQHGTGFMGINANKRNLALDLTKPKSIEIVHRLAAKADVVMENFRPGVMDKLGIGYEALSAINPQAHLLRRLGLRPERPGAHDRRLRRQDPGDERHHVGHRPPGDGADAGGLCRVRRHRRHDGGLRRVERALPAHAYGPRPARRRRHAGCDAVVPHDLRHRLHHRRPRAGPARQPGAKPAADGRRVQGARAATSCSPSTTRSSSSRWPRRSAGPTCRRTRASSTGRRGLPTMRRCAPSSRASSPRPTTRPGRRG